ncbi:hypothetical protein B9Z55_019009 [Caenorhabditis nigoni]|uniref:SPK domain-containing protein n=1 Tax=Caenorhabditis nigoni TaxID=1611254 RepID=A0A2G5TGT8_9PELO|nr:hypothetical protein B9Z55_019009 [Caenorhabditis nigoni]
MSCGSTEDLQNLRKRPEEEKSSMNNRPSQVVQIVRNEGVAEEHCLPSLIVYSFTEGAKRPVPNVSKTLKQEELNDMGGSANLQNNISASAVKRDRDDSSEPKSKSQASRNPNEEETVIIRKHPQPQLKTPKEEQISDSSINPSHRPSQISVQTWDMADFNGFINLMLKSLKRSRIRNSSQKEKCLSLKTVYRYINLCLISPFGSEVTREALKLVDTEIEKLGVSDDEIPLRTIRGNLENWLNASTGYWI